MWESKKLLGTDVDSTLHGAPSWFETMTTDVDRATTFYCGLFGWTSEVTPMPGSNYTTFKHGTTPVAGMMAITPSHPRASRSTSSNTRTEANICWRLRTKKELA